MSNEDDMETVKRVKNDFFAMVNFLDNVNIKESLIVRDQIKLKFSEAIGELTLEQQTWKALHQGLTEEIRKKCPELMEKVEESENLKKFQVILKEKLDSYGPDHGWRNCIILTIIGVILGYHLNESILYIILYGVMFFFIGLLINIFITNSPAVQGGVALFLYHRLKMTRMAKWLYGRALF